MTGRASEPLAQDLMRTVITVTLRSLNEDGDIYSEGLSHMHPLTG